MSQTLKKQGLEHLPGGNGWRQCESQAGGEGVW